MARRTFATTPRSAKIRLRLVRIDSMCSMLQSAQTTRAPSSQERAIASTDLPSLIQTAGIRAVRDETPLDVIAVTADGEPK